MSIANIVEIHTLASRVQPELLRVLATLPRLRQSEVLDFALFLEERAAKEAPAETAAVSRIKLRPVSADSLLQLTGVVALGGDALDDSEALYDDDGGN
jgi:cytochrome c